MFQGCFKGIFMGGSRVFKSVGVKGYFENVSRIFQVCFIGVSGCFVHVRRMVQGSCKGTAFLFQM